MKLLHTLFAALALAGSGATLSAVPNAPTGEIEKRFYADGPWAVSHRPSFGCCDSSGYAFDIYGPETPGLGGFKHPIVTWGNGTGTAPYNYDYLLRHLASWGFVVVATRQPNTGTGREIRDAARFMAAENTRPGSPFEGTLAVDRIGAMGHSQGATGVINAMRDSGGAIRTAIAMALPAQVFCSDEINCTDPSRLRAGSVFYLNGSLDVVISPSRQPKGTRGLQSNAAYYRAMPSTLPKFWATLRGANHNDMMGQPDCALVGSTCHNGVYGYLGYPTAWLMDQLQGDAEAHQAFVAGSGEIFFQPKNWANQTSNITP
ncbi:hypothetical protein AACH06_03555 [Ideonella sp. DXS29W]|uniref:Alpha/beta hydrolase n=1 Tax=Ideonella lacteola TaxID=2984193 RepID=A0ABU9BIU5_9BURK